MVFTGFDGGQEDNEIRFVLQNPEADILLDSYSPYLNINYNFVILISLLFKNNICYKPGEMPGAIPPIFHLLFFFSPLSEFML